MLLLSDSPIIALLPLVKNLFDNCQKPFRPRAKSKKVVAIAVNSYVSIYYWMGVISFEGKGSDR